MQLYDTRRRRVAELEPFVQGQIGLYSCGPTVYGDAHIGNFRTYIFEDVLVRALRYLDFNVLRVMNVTDVGHLVSDADEGEDKLEIGARRDGITAWEVAKRYEQRFLNDFDALGLERPDRLVRATETIPAQIDLIQQLEKRGSTYCLADGIYFDASTFPTYAELGRLDLAGQQAGFRVQVVEGKRHPYDFALWKFSARGTKRDMEWESPWGIGFPGWHIECSAIVMQELGEEIDIHCGGVDHITVHHSNEIAQSETVTGKRLARHWCHTEFLLLDGGKMSKSLGNLYTLADLAARGIEPAAFKLFTYSAHYRSKQNFSWEAAEAAQKNLQRLRYLFTQGGTALYSVDTLKRFDEALQADMNVPEALAVVWEVAQSDLSVESKQALARQIDRVFALDLLHQEIEDEIPSTVLAIANERNQAREAKQWLEADRLRLEVEAAGYYILDTHSGSKIRKQ